MGDGRARPRDVPAGDVDLRPVRLYVIRPGQQQIEMYAPSADGSVYPGTPSKRLPGPQKLDDVDAMLIDGDIYLAQGGKVNLVVVRSGWKTGPVGDETLHPTAYYTAIATSSHAVGTGSTLRILDDDQGTGTIYAYDRDNSRIVAFSKEVTPNNYQTQYRLANGDGVVGRRARLLPRARYRHGGPLGRLDRQRRGECRAAGGGARHDHRDGRAERIAVAQRIAEPQGDAEAQADEEAVTDRHEAGRSSPERRTGRGRVG